MPSEPCSWGRKQSSPFTLIKRNIAFNHQRTKDASSRTHESSALQHHWWPELFQSHWSGTNEALWVISEHTLSGWDKSDPGRLRLHVKLHFGLGRVIAAVSRRFCSQRDHWPIRKFVVPSHLGDINLSINRECFCSGVCSTVMSLCLSRRNWPIALSRFVKINLTAQTQIRDGFWLPKIVTKFKRLNYYLFIISIYLFWIPFKILNLKYC